MTNVATNSKGKPVEDTMSARTDDLPHNVTDSWKWQLVVAATEVAFGPVAVLIDSTGTDDYSPIKLMREPDYGA